MSRKTIIITDVTAMSADNVCIAGYYDSITCVRPVLSRSQLKKHHLFKGNELIVYPSALVSFNFIGARSNPPHVEDLVFAEDSIEKEGELLPKEWRQLLDKTATTKFSHIFPNMEDRYVPPLSDGPSLGTFAPANIPFLSCDYYKDPPRPRMRITDGTGKVIEKVAITDLALRSYFTALMKKYSENCETVMNKINSGLQERQVYLRLGLARPFDGLPEPYGGWCTLQVNGIHTFPDLYNVDYGDWIQLD